MRAAIDILQKDHKIRSVLLPLAYVHPPFTAPADFYGMYDPAKPPRVRLNFQEARRHEAIRRTRRLDRSNDSDFRRIQSVYLA